ncbi:Uncharacterised protein [Moraxella ovis]|nr:Uncharacterised protein [Moraxella ovis]
MDLALSIWGNENIVHTLVTFGFADGQRLAFSVEIRKEVGESFSNIGGFFRQFELSVIAVDEKTSSLPDLTCATNRCICIL